MKCHRLLCLLLSTVVIGICAEVSGAEPYKARVTTAQVFTRSGPGQNYYPTAYLEKNTIVEVYREDDGGWMAIRPTENEFSLLPVKALSYGDDRRFATVQVVDAPSYIGSQISDLHHVVHVKLDQNEPVEVLGIVELRDQQTGKKEAFYRIAPPAGEFRWINKHFIEALYPEPVAAPPRPQQDKVATKEAIEEAEFWKKAQNNVSTIRPVSYDAESETPAAARLTGDPLPVEKPAVEAFDPSIKLTLSELELKVSQECIKPADEWNFKPLLSQAKRLVDEGETPLERGKARLVQEKIEEFNELSERKLGAKKAFVPGTGPLRSPPIDSVVLEEMKPSDDPAASFKAEGFDPRYDGKGWLMPVITRASATRDPNQYTPPFALTDSQGNVLQFVSPSPGLNLRRYSRMEVGIYGQISPLGQLTKPHLTAHRIVVLSRHEKQ
ncbi:hypothetical protein [Bremerella cremea]|uniref:hypothetical protein n=1 Tax=Bremerella cremea TaxID=1031537 RepID=UPI0031E5ACA8